MNSLTTLYTLINVMVPRRMTRLNFGGFVTVMTRVSAIALVVPQSGIDADEGRMPLKLGLPESMLG
jgi:hypothetical protein